MPDQQELLQRVLRGTSQPMLPPEALLPFDEANARPPLRPWQVKAGQVFDAAIDGFFGMLGVAPTGETKANLVGQLLSAGAPVMGGVKALTNGMYSRLDEAAKLIPKKGVPASGVLNWMKKSPEGISSEEAAYRKLPGWLQAQGNTTVTPEALTAYLRENPAPFPQVKTLGVPTINRSSKYMIPEVEKLAQQGHGSADEAFLLTLENDGDIYRKLTKRFPALANDDDWGRTVMMDIFGDTNPVTPKFGQYQVRGGKNYRETLLTLPNNRAQKAINLQSAITKAEEYNDVPVVTLLRRVQINEEGGDILSRLNAARQPDGRYRLPQGDTGEFIPFEALERAGQALGGIREMRASEGFRSSHFDDPNILVHTRSNDRALPSGERGRFVEEVQSDWHQQGKKKGYVTDSSSPPDTSSWSVEPVLSQPRFPGAQVTTGGWEVMDGNGELLGRVLRGAPDNGGARNAEEAIAHVANNQPILTRQMAVPDAPFKETWPDLGLKQQLIEAANDPQAEWIGFTGGKTQAARYDLSKQISEVHYSGTNLKAYDLNGNEVISQTGVTPQELPDYIGKEAADKLMAQPARGTLRSLKGVDLQVGGEGMKAFYDDKLPKRLEKIVKPFRGTVEAGTVNAESPAAIEGMRRLAQQSGRPGDFQIKTEPMWFARLTPEMKEAIKRGVPLMSVLGALGIYQSALQQAFTGRNQGQQQ